MKLHVLAFSSLAVLMAGCQSSLPTREPAAALDDAAIAHALVTGTATIVGTLSVETDDHASRRGVFETVVLLPATPYTLECARILMTRRSNCGDRLAPYAQTTTTDRAGKFTFTGLSAGQYVLHSKVEWDFSRGKLGTAHVLKPVLGQIAVSSDATPLVVDLSNRG